MAEYSMVLNIDLGKDTKKYSFSLFHSVLQDDGKIVCIPVYDEWKTADDAGKEKLKTEVSIILRKLFDSEKESYEVLPEYSIV
jgi:hypothetical protein